MSNIFYPRRSSTSRLISSRNRSVDSRRNFSPEIEPEMADLDVIFKALRLVPDFDGNPNVLTRFIKLCDQLVADLVQEGQPLPKLALLNGILNKITGPAARLINANGIPNDWAGIRSALVNNFADQRDETALYNDLALLTQGSGTPQEFYERCQSLFSTVMTYVSLHDTLDSTIAAKRDLYRKLTLQAYLRGLKDPLGARIRCMRPETIEKALEFVHEETNTIYLQNRNDSLSDKKPSIKMPQNEINNKTPVHPNNMLVPIRPNLFNMPGPFRPQGPQFMPRPSQYQFGTPFNSYNMQPRGPTRTQQIFSTPPPNSNQGGSGFRMPPRNPNPPNNGPRPMSGVSHFVPRPLPATNSWNWAQQGNPPPSNYLKTRDVNVNECSNYGEDYYYPDLSDYFYFDPYYQDYFYFNDCTYDVTPQQTDGTNDKDQPGAVDHQQPSTSQDFQKAPKSNSSG